MGKENKPKISFKDLTREEKDRVVGVFTWLFKEDRKQNSHLYKKLIKSEDSKW